MIDYDTLIEKIREEKPDLIVIAGDMIVKNGNGLSDCLNLCRELIKICEVYYAPGNHEMKYQMQEGFMAMHVPRISLS